MARIAIGLEYDGSTYSGWQVQSAAPSIQAVVERALSIVADEPIAAVCAGRTDAGVHALQQVVHFDTAASRPDRGWVLGANAHLPDDVAVQWAMRVPDHFHARYSARSRTYRYVILNRSARSALSRSRVAWVPRPLDAQAMQAAATSLLGEHDFSAFRAAECQARSPVRELTQLDVARSGDFVVLAVTANAFLHHMVRNLAGLLIDIGRGDAPPARARQVLESRDRRQGAATAPASGLYFAAVAYPPEFGLPQPDSAIIPGLSSHPV
jgi:tRNA pseudouridine38-40 synthase